MSETARERFHRVQRETAGGDRDAVLRGEVADRAEREAPSAAAGLGARGPRAAADIHTGLRKAALTKRLAALGVPVGVGELADEPAELENLERMCVEFEAAGKAQ